jgi:putative flippase GtrA
MLAQRRGPAVGHRTGLAGSRSPTNKTHRSAARQFAGFAAVGVACALLYAILFVLLRGAGAPTLVANICATLTTSVISSAALRSVSFGARGPAARLRHLGQDTLLLAATLVISSTVFGLLDRYGITLTTVEELFVANTIGLVTGIIRFLLLRHWVYRPRPPQSHREWTSTVTNGQVSLATATSDGRAVLTNQPPSSVNH